LRAENTKLLEQREVLKKSLGILSEVAAERYARIEAMSGQYKVAWLCEALLVFAQWLLTTGSSADVGRVHARRKHSLRACIRESSCAVARLRQSALGASVGLPGRRKSHRSLMRQERSSLDKVPKYRPRTTDSTHGVPARLIASNILSFAVPITLGH